MTDDWFDIIAALLDADARFLTVGAHAMAAHGVPRGTQDLDVWIDPTEENAGRVWKALDDFVTAWDARDEHMVRTRQVPFLGRSTLVANERATGRTKDLADLEALGE